MPRPTLKRRILLTSIFSLTLLIFVSNIRAEDPETDPNCTVWDDFEVGAPGWFNDASSTCSAGTFVAGDPTNLGGVQIVGSHSGVTSIFTAVNTSAGDGDVDGGNCVLRSPTWAVTDDSTLSIWYWHGQRDSGDDPAGDFFRLETSLDGGATWSTLVSNGDLASSPVWTNATASVPANSNVQLRIQASDGAGAGDLIEAGIDDFSICGGCVETGAGQIMGILEPGLYHSEFYRCDDDVARSKAIEKLLASLGFDADQLCEGTCPQNQVCMPHVLLSAPDDDVESFEACRLKSNNLCFHVLDVTAPGNVKLSSDECRCREACSPL